MELISLSRFVRYPAVIFDNLASRKCILPDRSTDKEYIDHHKSTSLLDVTILVKHLKILKLQHTITKWGASNETDLEERPIRREARYHLSF